MPAMTIRSHPGYRSTCVFFRTVAAVFLLYAFFNFLYDPTGVFFDRGEKPDLQLVNSAWLQVREVLRHPEECDSFILDTSRAYVWDARKLGSGWCKIAINNRGIGSYANVLRLFVRRGVTIKSVIIIPEYEQYFNVARFDYYASAYNEMEYPDTAFEGIYSLYKLLFLPVSTEGLRYFIHRVSAESAGTQETWRDILHKPSLQWFPIVAWSPERRMKWLTDAPAYEGVLEYRHYEPEREDEILRDILNLGAARGFKVTVMITPSSIKNIVASDKDDRFDIYRRLARIIPFYDFSDDIDRSMDIRFWLDPTHYNAQVADGIIRDLARAGKGMTFGRLITAGNVDSEIQKIQNDVNGKFIDRPPYPPHTFIHESWLDRPADVRH